MKPIEGLEKAASSSGKQSQSQVVYMTGDQGPFRCDHCEYYVDPGGCKKVEGTIDPAGCCNLFEKGEASVGGTEESSEYAPGLGGY